MVKRSTIDVWVVVAVAVLGGGCGDPYKGQPLLAATAAWNALAGDLKVTTWSPEIASEVLSERVNLHSHLNDVAEHDLLAGQLDPRQLEQLRENVSYEALARVVRTARDEPVVLSWPRTPFETVEMPPVVEAAMSFPMLGAIWPETIPARVRDLLLLARSLQVRRAVEFNLFCTIATDALKMLHRHVASNSSYLDEDVLRQIGVLLVETGDRAVQMLPVLLSANLAAISFATDGGTWNDAIVDGIQFVNEVGDLAPQELGFEGVLLSVPLREMLLTAPDQPAIRNFKREHRFALKLAAAGPSEVTISRFLRLGQEWPARLCYRLLWLRRALFLGAVSCAALSNEEYWSDLQSHPLVRRRHEDMLFEGRLKVERVDETLTVSVSSASSDQHRKLWRGVRDTEPLSWSLRR